MSVNMQNLLFAYDHPAPFLRALPHRRTLAERMERARGWLLHAEVEWLLSAHLYATPANQARYFARYQRSLALYTGLFERACAEAGMGGEHG